MASPQLENGYTAIANEILHALMACKLLNYEFRVLTAVVRKTYGWRKKTDWISNSQLSEVTGIAKPNITRTVASLVKKNILVREGRKIGLQKDWEKWNVEWYVEEKVISRDNSVISPDNKKLSHQIPTKERKETITKETSEADASAEKDMSWNKQTDDYEEGVVDMDGDGSLAEEKKKNTRKYPNAPKVRKVFQEVLGRNPANWRVNKTQLIACENLSTERGEEKIRSALEYYQTNKDDKYIPKIDSPYDLDSKWTKLGQHKLDHE